MGSDDDRDWTISGENAGSATDIALFEGFENITGGSGDDEFTLTSAGSVTGQIDGGDGDDYLVGPDTKNVWTLSGEDSGQINNVDENTTTGAAAFVQIENITGGDDVDEFRVTTIESITGQIAGGEGTDKLVGADDINSWTISGNNSGTLNDADFIEIENLTGGAGDDAFSISSAAALSGLLDGGLFDFDAPTVNSVSYASWNTAVTVNLETLAAPGLAGGFAQVTRFVGGASFSDQLIGPVSFIEQATWTITSLDAGNVDGTAFSGFENLTGQNDSSDAFILMPFGVVTGTIAGGRGPLTASRSLIAVVT